MSVKTAVTAVKNHKLLLLLCGAFTLRLFVFILFRPWDSHVQHEAVLIYDASGYHRLALCLIDRATFCGNTFRTPGYPFFIAVIYQLVGVKPWAVLFAQILVDLVSIYFVFKIGEVVFSKHVGMLAAAFLAIDPNAILWTSRLYSDGLFVAFLMPSLYFYSRAIEKGGQRSLLIAGGLLGLAALVRPVAQYYELILLSFILLWPARDLAARINGAVLCGLAFALTISPWVYRNYDLYGTPKLSSVQGENLLFYQVAYVRAWETHQPGDAVIADYRAQAKAAGYLDGGNPFINEAIAQQIAVRYIKAHPAIYAYRWCIGMLHTYENLGTADIVSTLGWAPTRFPVDAMFASDSESALISKFFQSKQLPEIISGLTILALLLANYVSFALGAIVLARRHRWMILAFFGVSILFLTVTGGPIGLARFRLPIAPFYLLVGAVYVEDLLSRRAARISITSR
jgi:4-amino-4-deoxy-L-arabinose transferase-like glycosyltransferase